MKITVLGLGLMGGGMASRLISAGFEVTVYNRDTEKTARFADTAQVASSPGEAVAAADVVISMLADDGASRAVWEAAIPYIKRGAVCIESSTVSLDWAKAWAASVESAGALPLDAPVTGSKSAASAGELVFIVGGAEEAVQRALPAFKAMGKDVIRLGDSGSGCLFKLINNFMCGVQLASLAEALTMIERGGLDLAKTVDLLASGAPGSPLVKLVSPRMLSGDFTPNFLLRLMTKDLTYAKAEASKHQIDLVTGEAARKLFASAIEGGYGDQDIAAIGAYVRGI